MSKYILPVFILLIVIIGLIKRVNIYNSFSQGSKDAIELALKVCPYVISIMIVLELFEVSGLNILLEKALSPILTMLGIPSELASLIIIRPLSGSGSYAILDGIIKQYGADSYIARCGCIISGASETIFYITSIYLSSTKIKKLRYAIPVALFASFVGVIFSCLIARVM